MLKLIVSSSAALFVLTGSALADPTPAPAPAPAAISAVRLAVSVHAGADTRTHDLVISDAGCGTVAEKAAAYEDNIRVCSRPAANGLLIETEWFTRSGATEYRNRSEVVVPRKGGTAEVGRTGGMRLSLKVG